jgi:tripartite-type tricarboxylate transporter receptor subunit TctC
LPALKSVPTALEQGVDAVMPAERGFAAPKGLSPAIADKLQAAVEKTLKDPEYLAKAANDAPVLAYLPGSAWSREIAGRDAGYRTLARSMPKE